MASDVYLVIGFAILILAIPSIVSSFSERRAPRIAAILVLIGGGLIVLALNQKPGGYTLQEIPMAITRVVAKIIK